MTYSIFDIADWFLSKESMTHKKLQKLCYYTQAWGLALYNIRIMNTKFEAWIHGPVSEQLFAKYESTGWQKIPQADSTVEFDEQTEDVLENVWYRYGDLTGDELEAVTHEETPWQEKREGMTRQTPGYAVISEDTMRTFYQQQMKVEQVNC